MLRIPVSILKHSEVQTTMQKCSVVFRDDREVLVSISPFWQQLHFGNQFVFTVANKNQDPIFLSSSKCTGKRQKVNILLETGRISIIDRVDVAILPTSSNPARETVPMLLVW